MQSELIYAMRTTRIVKAHAPRKYYIYTFYYDTISMEAPNAKGKNMLRASR